MCNVFFPPLLSPLEVIYVVSHLPPTKLALWDKDKIPVLVGVSGNLDEIRHTN